MFYTHGLNLRGEPKVLYLSFALKQLQMPLARPIKIHYQEYGLQLFLINLNKNNFFFFKYILNKKPATNTKITYINSQPSRSNTLNNSLQLTKHTNKPNYFSAKKKKYHITL